METKNWEVELKFHLDNAILLAEKLMAMGFQAVSNHAHEDIYFRHPDRDFKTTDEALRLRRVDNWACMTYKGPRQAGPVKTREEIELELDASSLTQWQTMLQRLGFQPLPPVRKNRSEYRSDSLEHSELTVVIDRVEELGEFAEIEIVVADVTELKAAQDRILALSERLGLQRLQPRSYLDQLLELRGK